MAQLGSSNVFGDLNVQGMTYTTDITLSGSWTSTSGTITIKDETGGWWQRISTADTTDLAVHRFKFEERQGSGSYIELAGIDGNGDIWSKTNKVWHAGNLTFGTAATNMSAGNHTHVDATTTSKGFVQVGTGLGVTTGTISVTYGTIAGTACQGNDSRLTDSRAPSAHTDTAHTHQRFARITFTGGSQNIAYQWNHGLNSASVIFSAVANSPETHFYYSVVDNNNVKIYLDDAPYETVIIDATATLSDIAHLTTATANLTS